MRYLLLLALLTLTGCQGLSSALGISPAAQAPVYNGNGVVALPGAWVDIVANPDQSGAVGASGSATQSQSASQDVTIDPAAVAKALAEVAPLVTPGGMAAKALEKAQAALMSGDLARAEKLVGVTRGFAEVEAGVEPVVE
jgi:hypothetical protein